MKIIDYIPVGHDNAVTRDQLRHLTGLGDRTIREMIEEERKHTVILNLGDARGYFRPAPGEEGLIRVCRNKEKNRCRSIQGNIRAMEAALYSRKKKGIPGQMSMFGGG